MRDYCDSPSFKEHPLFRDDPNALKIQLYYDDVEVVNPLGGNTKVHKLGVVSLLLDAAHSCVMVTRGSTELSLHCQNYRTNNYSSIYRNTVIR